MKNKLKKLVRYAIPVPVKKALKVGYYSLLDARDFVTGKTDPDYPPRRLNFVGSADFKAVGNEFVQHFKAISQLKPDEHVLDIGSGIGRIAIPLTKVLSTKAQYRGFDIDARGVQWCREHVTPRHPNFQFEHANIFNAFYNPAGPILAKDFRFPYPDHFFDFAFATSVFTHMLARDVEHYLDELHRVLKPGGRYFITFFLLNDGVGARMASGKTTANFAHQDAECRHAFFSHKAVKEAEIAYDESWVRSALAKRKLDDHLTIHPGWWSGVEGTSYQDIITGFSV